MDVNPDAKRFAPATLRNREPILAVLQKYLSPTGTILEIASGSGEHAVFFAPHFPDCPWLPSDADPTARASIAAWKMTSPATNLYAPIPLDVQAPTWPVETPDILQQLIGFDVRQDPIQSIVNINMIHIAPWTACLGLMAGAQRILPPGGILYLYGPFQQSGQHTAPSNEAFDASLKAQNPAWGVRHLEDVAAIADQHQLTLLHTIAMPANNLSVLFQKV